MTNIEIENIIYKVHPVYNLYASDGEYHTFGQTSSFYRTKT